MTAGIHGPEYVRLCAGAGPAGAGTRLAAAAMTLRARAELWVIPC